MKSVGLHEFIATELDELAPALAWSRLSGYWGFRLINEGANFMEYQRSDEATIDQAFLRGNADANALLGFELEETKGQKFYRFADYYEHCVAEAYRTSINPPYDLPQSFEDLVEARRKGMRSVMQKENECDSMFKDSKYLDMVVDASAQARRKWQEQREDAVLAALDFVLSEMTGRMSIVVSQTSNAGNMSRAPAHTEVHIDPRDMDETMGIEKQYAILGEVDRDLMKEDRTYYGTGLREAYRKAAGILRSIYAYNEEVHMALYYTMNTFIALMDYDPPPIIDPDDWVSGKRGG